MTVLPPLCYYIVGSKLSDVKKFKSELWARCHFILLWGGSDAVLHIVEGHGDVIERKKKRIYSS